MAKRTTRVGRDGRPKLNEAQLQAYRARKAATVVVTETPSTDAPAKRAEQGGHARRPEQTGHVTAWGHVGEEYEMIRGDLIRLLLITVGMFAIIVALWFFLA